jgi:predicted metal-dependent hydrolase
MLHSSRLVWCDGVAVNWLGGQMVVQLGAAPGDMAPPARGSRRANAKRQPLVQLLPATAEVPHHPVLALGLPQAATAAQIRDTVQAWMMQAAVVHFEQRLNHFAPLLAVRWSSLRLSSAATRWGSAKADGSIRLHWRLMEFSPAVVDYVVAHELAHLRHMDHSPRFWQTVASVVPDYATLRAQLKGERLPPW